MSDFRVRVTSTPPRRPKGPFARLTRRLRQLARARLMRPRALIIIGLAIFGLFVGTPHVGWDYGCRHALTIGQRCKAVTYCAYYGVQGRRVQFPDDGESCKLITILPLDWQKLTGGQ